jgi:hypothetical protein
MISILLIVFLVLFLGVNLMAFAFCRSASMADRKLENRHIMRAADFSSAITKPIGKRDSGNSSVENPNVALRQYGLFP